MTGGTLATIICMSVLAIIVIVAIIINISMHMEKDDYAGEVTFVIVAIILIAGISVWWGMYPWKADYHEWREHSGIVDTAPDSRILTDTASGSIEQKFVVKFIGDDQQYGVNDTRAAGLKPGDHLTITCVHIFQWSGTHGYDCNFVSMHRG